MCKKICCGLFQLGGKGETGEKGIDLKNPNVKYQDLHTKTTGSHVRECTMKHIIICCYL